MARKKTSDQQVRVAEGIYRRGDAYLVPIYNPEKNGGKGGKDWHGPSCGPGCRHTQIVDLPSAKDAKRELEAQKRQGRRGQAQETVAGWAGSERGGVPRWLQVFPRKKESTNRHNAERVRVFGATFGERPLRSLTEEEVWAWARRHTSAVKEVRSCLNDAIKLKLLDVNPLEHYKLADRRGRADIETLSVGELDDALLPTARRIWDDYGENMEAMIEVGAWTGMRPGELFLLSAAAGNDANGGRVNLVDFERGMIDVQWQWNAKTREIDRPKWDSMRQVVLLPRARAAIERLPRSPEGWLFVTQRMSRFSQRNLHYYWDPVRRAFAEQLPASHWLRLRMTERGKDGNLDFYELRHFFGTALAHPPAGIRPASPYEIAQQMGHKDGGALAMRLYIHTKGLEVVDALNAAWGDHAPRARPARGVA